MAAIRNFAVKNVGPNNLSVNLFHKFKNLRKKMVEPSGIEPLTSTMPL